MAIGKFLSSGLSRVTGPAGIQSIDDLIKLRTPRALEILTQGNQEQLRLERQGLAQATDPLRGLLDERAFEEQQTLLGLRGEQAQEEAIGGIPISQFDQEFQKRQRQALMRGAAARGEAGGGATLQAGAQLAGAQQADIIGRRLAQLEPATALQRGLRGALSQIGEGGLSQQEQTQFGLGTQLANIRLGATAPQISSIQNQAELSGLRGISQARQQGQQLQQIVGLGGMLFGGS